MTNDTTPSPSTGINNTVVPSTATCNNKQIEIAWNNMVLGNIWSGQTKFNTTMYTILYITVAGVNQDLPIENFDWVVVTGLYAYKSTGAWTNQVRKTDMWNTATNPSLASTATVAVTSLNRGGMVELSFSITNLATSIGSSTNKILLVDFVGSSGWTGANDPLASYSSTDAVLLI